MSAASSVFRSARTIRWIARIWSLAVFAVALIWVLTPDPYATTGSIAMVDWFLLSLWGVAILGLLVAWKWERTGAILTIATMFFRELAWVILKGGWLVGFLIIWVGLVPPAILFLVAWRMERRAQVAMNTGRSAPVG